MVLPNRDPEGEPQADGGSKRAYVSPDGTQNRVLLGLAPATGLAAATGRATVSGSPGSEDTPK